MQKCVYFLYASRFEEVVLPVRHSSESLTKQLFFKRVSKFRHILKCRKMSQRFNAATMAGSAEPSFWERMKACTLLCVCLLWKSRVCKVSALLLASPTPSGLLPGSICVPSTLAPWTHSRFASLHTVHPRGTTEKDRDNRDLWLFHENKYNQTVHYPEVTGGQQKSILCPLIIFKLYSWA